MASQQSLLGDSQPGGSTNQQTRMESQQANGLQTVLPEQPRMITIPGVGMFVTFEGIWPMGSHPGSSVGVGSRTSRTDATRRQVQIQNPLRSGASTPPEDPSSGSPRANEAFRWQAVTQSYNHQGENANSNSRRDIAAARHKAQLARSIDARQRASSSSYRSLGQRPRIILLPSAQNQQAISPQGRAHPASQQHRSPAVAKDPGSSVHQTASTSAWQSPNARVMAADSDNEEEEDDTHPYLRDVDPAWGANMTDEELIQAFQELQQHCPPCTGKVIKSIEIDPYRGKVRVDQMRRAAVILHTMDLMPTVAKVEEWAVGRLHQELGVRVVQVRLLSRKHFLIILGSEEDKVKVLTAPTLYMWRRMVFVTEWTSEFNHTKVCLNKLPVWIDLPQVHPVAETYGDEMISSLGEVLYKTVDKAPNNHLHIRARVQINLAEPLVDTVEIKKNGTVLFRQPVHYQKLPNICFLCHDTCHWIKDYPLKVAENQKKADLQTEDQAQGRGGRPRRRNEEAEDFRQV
ncbi:hypothetical protein R1sor_015200 [Riccia sorocarpa]|uniref:DUF4283 domain-containing protein n=1 Tax=Riccia sorocarpa TaxID=122646 RepID=A0ABD3HDF1_9MARC